MALNVPDVGENLILEMLVNKTAAQNLSLRLFQSNTTPADTDTAGTFTESTFTGYAAITLTGASWNSAASGSIAYSAQQTFTCSGASSQNVYGYYVTQVTSGILVWAERDASAPFAIANSGDAVKITPAITAS
jgi:hypothetical protein